MRRSRIGRTVGRIVGCMRPIWRVIAAITQMRRPHASAACVGRNASVAKRLTMHRPNLKISFNISVLLSTELRMRR